MHGNNVFLIMRIHLLALPNAQTTREYSLCGFTQATIRFARILEMIGAEVILYASEENEAPCKELVTCITKEEVEAFKRVGNWEYQYAYIEEWSPLFQLFNSRATVEINKRKQPRDLICQIGGYSQRYVTDNIPDLMTIEYSIGYLGSFSPYRIFQSAIWQHATYGQQQIQSGRFYDDVIPCFFDQAEFEFCDAPEDYFVYVGRLAPRKGIQVACDVATAAGVKLKIVGHGDQSLIRGDHEYVGAVNMWERNLIMSKAKAIIAPTLYLEPFGCSPVEAQMCGTPVISTNFGAFVETVEHGKTGYRCNYMGEFVRAIRDIDNIDRNYVRNRALKTYSLEAVKDSYVRYFDRISTLWGNGWNTIEA